jgi:hypothetical protein
MIRTPEETALLIALLLKRSEQKRARISVDTVRRLSKRKRIRVSFIEMLRCHLDDLGVILVELERGGYGVIPSSILDGAPVITAKKYLTKELELIKQKPSYFDKIREEIGDENNMNDDEV